jgi:GcrA cell cycle regulator
VVRRPAAPMMAAPVYSREETGSATVLTLGAHMCKWPIGDPAVDGFSFCGRRTGEEGPYCREHAQLAYQPQQKKTKRPGDVDLARSLRRYI